MTLCAAQNRIHVRMRLRCRQMSRPATKSRVNFAISTRAAKAGLDHLGIQAENGMELEEIGSRLAQADVSLLPQKGASCCYAKSDKYWTLDPQGIAWESFHSLDSVPVYGEDRVPDPANKSACCAPASV